MDNLLETIIDGTVLEVSAKTTKGGKRYAEMLLEVTETFKNGDKKFTLPMWAWGDMKDRCMGLAVGQKVTVTAKVGGYTTAQGYANVTLTVKDVDTGMTYSAAELERMNAGAGGDPLPF